MKNLIIAVALLLSINSIAQKFEGTIKWSLKMDITDPKQKAQMEEAQKKLNDPATQAQIKQMQEKMNDPQFKAMMESNPQLKAQMDGMMAGMQGGSLNSLLPSAFTIKMKNQNSLTKMEGGMFASEILQLAETNKTYSLDRKNKTYSVMTASGDAANKVTGDSDIKVTKTSETAKILNYTCTKYIVDITNKKSGTKTTQFIWATTEIKDFDLKALAKQRFGQGQHIFYENIEGVPLKIEMKMNGNSMKMEVVEIKKESISDTDFVIPTDFKEVPGMFK